MVNTSAVINAAAEYLPIKQRTMGIGVVNTASNLGNIIAPLTVVPFAVVYLAVSFGSNVPKRSRGISSVSFDEPVSIVFCDVPLRRFPPAVAASDSK